MPMTENKHILIITGDYEVVRRVRQALRGGGFGIQVAYSHLDGIYILENGSFDLVIVDAGLFDRLTGHPSFRVLAQLKPQIPILALTPNGKISEDAALPRQVIALPLQELVIQRQVAELFGLSFADQGADSDMDVVVRPHSPSEARRSEERQTLFDLSRSLTEVLDLTDVLNRVVEAARRLTNAEEGMILLPEDEDAGALYLRAKVGIDVEVARNFRVKTHDTLAGNVFNTGRPMLIGAQGPQKVKTEYLVNALLYVPIQYKGKSIGVLGVNNKSKDMVFDPRHEELLLNLASFAAIAIENARIHEETLARTQELQSLVEASEVLNASLSLERMLPNICEQLGRMVNVSYVTVYQWNRGNNTLEMLAQHFRTTWPVNQGKRIPLAQWASLRVALDEGRPLVSQVDGDDEAARFYLEQRGVHTVVSVPVTGGEQVLGTVQLFYVNAPASLPEAETISRIRHLALEGLVTLSNQQDEQVKNRSVLRLGADINRMGQSNWCELAVAAPDQNALHITLAVGDGVWLDDTCPALDVSRYPDLLETLRTQTPINKHSDNKILPPGVRTLLEMSASRALVGLPLVQRGETTGLVVLADMRRSRVFSSREIDLARTMAGQAATALENAQLVHDLEASLIELKETQSRLVQTARLSAMGELAAVVAHQINNPLTTIMVDSEMLLLDEPADSRNHKALQAIARAGRRASSVARRLLAIARPSDASAQDEPIDVVDTIDGVLSLVRAHIERDNIQIIPNLPQVSLPS
ncbi:MAG: GAF domain-containing protein, partial [Anaerolineae bacterium]|nr:GAF domain-containing protein [Anaerolineae bacterium]